jgi:hypothetical protein
LKGGEITEDAVFDGGDGDGVAVDPGATGRAAQNDRRQRGDKNKSGSAGPDPQQALAAPSWVRNPLIHPIRHCLMVLQTKPRSKPPFFKGLGRILLTGLGGDVRYRTPTWLFRSNEI